MLKLAVLLSVPPLCFAFRFFGNSRRASPLATLKLMRMMMDESGSSNGAGGGVRTYSSYALYKGKGALAVKPLPATLVTSGSARTVSRNGGMLLEFALASGPREYNWKNKESFLLDVTECGGLLESCAAREGVDFIHDPNIGTTLAGQVTKRLKLMPMQDGKGMFISLVVSDRVAGAPVTFSVPVTWAEMRVIACLTEYCIPRLLAFDCLWSNNAQQQPQQGGGGGGGEYLPPSSSAMY